MAQISVGFLRQDGNPQDVTPYEFVSWGSRLQDGWTYMGATRLDVVQSARLEP
jgi:hypothetical protein